MVEINLAVDDQTWGIDGATKRSCCGRIATKISLSSGGCCCGPAKDNNIIIIGFLSTPSFHIESVASMAERIGSVHEHLLHH